MLADEAAGRSDHAQEGIHMPEEDSEDREEEGNVRGEEHAAEAHEDDGGPCLQGDARLSEVD